MAGCAERGASGSLSGFARTQCNIICGATARCASVPRFPVSDLMRRSGGDGLVGGGSANEPGRKAMSHVVPLELWRIHILLRILPEVNEHRTSLKTGRLSDEGLKGTPARS